VYEKYQKQFEERFSDERENKSEKDGIKRSVNNYFHSKNNQNYV